MTANKRKIVDENRQYCEQWEEKYFFVVQNSKLMCLICRETIAVFKEYNVKRHYETKHGEYLKLAKEVKQYKLTKFKSHLSNQQTMFSSSLQKPSNIVKASYSIAYLISKNMKPFSDGEFVKECLEAVIKDLMPEKTKLFFEISLSRQTICSRISDISNELLTNLHYRIRDFKYFSLAFDDSTDTSDTAQLAVFIRGINESFEITEEMLNLLSLKGTTRGEDIFQAVDKCLFENNLRLEILSGITTDGAPAMAGKDKGAIKLLNNKLQSNNIDTEDLIIIHCVIHQQHLCSQMLSMDNVMKVVIKTVNFIRSHALRHRQFKELLKDLESEYGDITYFTHVRWLSRGKCLRRFYELRQEIDFFMKGKQNSVPELSNDEWLLDLCFSVEIVEKLNLLNTSLQGKNNLVTDAFNHIKAFQRKLLLFESQLKNNNVQHFTLLKEFENFDCNNASKYAKEIRRLITAFDSRFSDLVKHEKIFEIYSSPFYVDIDSAPINLQMELINLQCNNELRHMFHSSESKIDFYKKYITKENFSNLRNLAQRVVSSFGSTYTCESFFSKMKFTKNKSRVSLTDENLQNQLRCACTSFDIDLKKLSEKKEKQISH